MIIKSAFFLFRPFSTAACAGQVRKVLKKHQIQKAINLIYGSKPYLEFSSKEKRLVNLYQKETWKEDGIILPNTRMVFELDKAELLYHKHRKHEE